MAKVPDIKTIIDTILKPKLCPAPNRLITSTHTYSVSLPVSLFMFYQSELKKKVWYGISPVIIQFSSYFNLFSVLGTEQDIVGKMLPNYPKDIICPSA